MQLDNCVFMQPLPKNRGGLFPNKPNWGNQPSWMSRGSGGWMIIERK